MFFWRQISCFPARSLFLVWLLSEPLQVRLRLVFLLGRRSTSDWTETLRRKLRKGDKRPRNRPACTRLCTAPSWRWQQADGDRARYYHLRSCRSCKARIIRREREITGGLLGIHSFKWLMDDVVYIKIMRMYSIRAMVATGYRHCLLLEMFWADGFVTPLSRQLL